MCATRLQIEVKKRDIDRMIAYPGPTYLVGIDERNERGYIASIERPLDGDLHGLPMTFPIDCESLEILWNEVDAYWKHRGHDREKIRLSRSGEPMKVEDKWFIDERTRALATMYLTRRRDLILKYEGEDAGIDILVEIDERMKTGRRMFGVELKGTKSKTTISLANKGLKPSVQRFRRFPELPYPVCLIYFTMVDNAGYYTWLTEPVIETQSAKLKRHEAADCRLLDRAGLDELVDRVNAWYDVFYSTILV